MQAILRYKPAAMGDSGIAFIILPIILMLAIAMVVIAPVFPARAAEPNCDIHDGTCTAPLSEGNGTIILDISPKPVRAMTDLNFNVQVTGLPDPAPPYIDLGMPGMKMGPNRVMLRETDNGAYIGTGVIVRCPSGKTLWQATVTVPGAGTAEFIFHVVY